VTKDEKIAMLRAALAEQVAVTRALREHLKGSAAEAYGVLRDAESAALAQPATREGEK
jgi:hypothetical protein